MADDSDAADNWEALDDHTELNKQLEKLVSKVEEQKINNAFDQSSFSSTTATILTTNKPAIRILRRDTTQSQSTPSLKSMVASKPVRTIEEREAAYAKARLRIMGSADDTYPSDGLEGSAVNSSGTTLASNKNCIKNTCTNTKPLSSSSSSTSVNSKKQNPNLLR
ncbi:hypothetical protein HELRODRAFT_161460 [Helobdella robusta]|uniref:SUZ domain-containing protein n=1 Tax=Helobdella robusta TaxID=6412 RepID=T1ERH8_HELRO|nr:hypothetical protein HELRODRAFT_161460 [Helobdella robusta]ESO02217.1 hypothetical protein HELRODRAFT_161460 [Helobdella robusta]